MREATWLITIFQDVSLAFDAHPERLVSLAFPKALLAHQMEQRNLLAKVYEVEGCGHAPTLMGTDQIKLVSDFLTSQASFA